MLRCCAYMYFRILKNLAASFRFPWETLGCDSTSAFWACDVPGRRVRFCFKEEKSLKIECSTLGDFYGQGGGKEGALPSALAVTTTMEEEVNIIISSIEVIIIIIQPWRRRSITSSSSLTSSSLPSNHGGGDQHHLHHHWHRHHHYHPTMEKEVSIKPASFTSSSYHHHPHRSRKCKKSKKYRTDFG